MLRAQKTRLKPQRSLAAQPVPKTSCELAGSSIERPLSSAEAITSSDASLRGRSCQPAQPLPVAASCIDRGRIKRQGLETNVVRRRPPLRALTYAGSRVDVAINYTVLFATAALFIFGGPPKRRAAILSFFAAFQLGLCYVIGCAGISIIWCACAGGGALDHHSGRRLVAFRVVAVAVVAALLWYALTAEAITALLTSAHLRWASSSCKPTNYTRVGSSATRTTRSSRPERRERGCCDTVICTVSLT